MVSRVAASFIIGQGVSWIFGYDQLGLSMEPKKEFGYGRRVSRWAQDNLEPEIEAVISLKLIEVTTELLKARLEAQCYARHGIVPDAVACAFSQPLWSYMEAGEKAVSALARPYRTVEQDAVGLCIACTYGSLFRCGQAIVVLVIGDQINRVLSKPIEAGLRKLLGMG